MKRILLCLSLSMVLVLTAAAADVTGKWSGSFVPEGGDNGTAYVILKQSGNTITGSGGPDANDQWPGLKGTITGNKVSFEVKSPTDGAVYKGALVLEGDHLKGDVMVTTPEGQAAKAKLDLARVNE